MPYRITFSSRAERQLAALSRETQERIKACIDGLADNPRPPGVRKLHDREIVYRVRVGEYRIVYEIHDATHAVVVVKVAHRSKAYQG